jgi:hypothetical protein
MMAIDAPIIRTGVADAEQLYCPFDDRACNTCSASLSGFNVGTERRMVFCSTDNYDACPFFLSRVIRKKY